MRNDLDRMGSTLGKVKKPLKKKEEGNKVTYDAKGYAINPDKSIEELTAGTTVLDTHTVKTKGDRYARSIKKGKLREKMGRLTDRVKDAVKGKSMKTGKLNTAFRLGQKVSNAGDTTSFELRPGKTEIVDDEDFGIVPMTTYEEFGISNQEYRRRMNKSANKKK
tara:strand:- start:1181 stop:1672 length:492 start_codon:yes stop_codon:yes gene_type:complete